MKTKLRSDQITSKKPPLSLTEKKAPKIAVPRHSVVAASVVASSFESGVFFSEKPPEVVTKLVPIRQGRQQGWRVEVEFAGASISRLNPKPVTPVIVERRTLAKQVGDLLKPSMPQKDVFALKPKQVKRTPFYLRFGKQRFEPTTIFRPDGRNAYYDTRYPWRCLVRITTPSGWSGSGVLIGPRHVLTASHCVDWTPGWLRADVLYRDGSQLASASGTLAYAESRIAPGSISKSDSDEDYAVIVLNERLGDRFGWLGAKTYDSGWDNKVSAWYSVGYPQDFSSTGQTPCFQTNFLLDEDDLDLGSARLLKSSTFDNIPGQSGSPIFGFWNDGPYVVGVVSGQNPEYNSISGGSLLTSLVNRARRENP